MKSLKNSSNIKDLYNSCVLCPWECGFDRSKKKGVCRSGASAKVSSHIKHLGEEPMISGTNGSGTIFFSSCSLRCKFCQNWQISQDGLGEEISDEALAEIMIKLEGQGAHNINLVSPTHFIPNIISALDIARKKGYKLPVVYNSNGYEMAETIRMLDGYVDIYLPDMKYSSDDMAVKYSNAPSYHKYNKESVAEMFRQVGNLKVDGHGIAVKGLMIRHLVLPDDIAGSRNIFKFLAGEISKDVQISIMSQYNPCHEALKDVILNRRIRPDEYQRAVRWAEEAGLHNILVQEMESSDLFNPDFSKDKPFS
jgi:putative pyruvate formate lyase activating enzyme